MVRYYFYIFILLLSAAPLQSFAQSPSFDAYIDRENVSEGENFQVKMELVGANPTSPPDISPIPPELKVTSQQQQASVTYVNGAQSQNIAWILDIMAQKQGTYNVPAIEVQTNAGPLYTKPFKIFVKAAGQLSAATSDNSVFIEVQTDKLDPYIDEPILYKTIVYHLGEISNAELVKPKAENAIIEQISEPKPSRQLLNGINYKMIEVSYLITPVHTGTINIEPSILRGKIAKPANTNPQNQNSLDSLFGGPGLNPMAQYTSFTVASKPVSLTVKPAEAGVEPWLALYSLNIDDELADVTKEEGSNRIMAKVGEPITRKIRLTALGKGGEALPDIDNLFNGEDFKVYADRPEFSKEFVEGEGPVSARIKGTKTQNFTFIPQRTGMLTMPGLQINYWSLKDNKIATAALENRVVTSVAADGSAEAPNNIQTTPQTQQAGNSTQNVQPGNEPDINQPPSVPQTMQEKMESKLEQLSNSPQGPNAIILLLAVIICIIIFISFKVITQARKNPGRFDDSLLEPGSFDDLDRRASRKIIDPKPGERKVTGFSKNKKEVESYIEQINSSGDHETLQRVLQKFANRFLGLSGNAGTVMIASEMAAQYNIDKQSAMKYAAELDSVLYAGKHIDLEYLKNGFAGLISAIEQNSKFSNIDNNKTGLTSLNP